MSDSVVSVADLLTRINTLFASSLQMGNVWIQGEVGSLTKHASGHYYFTLKDESAQISCTMWRSAVSQLRFSLEEGMKVLVQGTVSVYEKSGRMQLNVRNMKPDGIGALFLELEQRKQRLKAAGYFEESHKKRKPPYIGNIAVVTGANTAALQDVLKTIRRRWPMMEVHLYPALVQGQNAPAEIIRALRQADQGGHDAILLVRGGGSFEDLFCFSDENLVRTIYGLNTYVVSGIGHDVDWTLSDFVSDHRAVTPTAAAQWVSWDQEEIRNYLLQEQNYLINRIQQLLSQSWQQLSWLETSPYLSDPMAFFHTRQLQLESASSRLLQARNRFSSLGTSLNQKEQELCWQMEKIAQTSRTGLQLLSDRLDPALLKGRAEHQEQTLSDLRHSLEQSIKRLLKNAGSALAMQKDLLEACSPDVILKKGYARLEQDGTSVSSLKALNEAAPFTLILQDGRMEAEKVKE